MTNCYPITEHIITSSSSCAYEWRLIEPVGIEGTYAEIWSTCCLEDCNHVLKYMSYENNTVEAILNEINLQYQCSLMGLCPIIEEAWLCPSGGVMVMQLYEMTVAQLLLMYKDTNVRQKILANIISLTDKLHMKGIYHGDFHLDNIMVKAKNTILNKFDIEEQLYEAKDYQYYFIDFGKGGVVERMDSPQLANDYSDIWAHVQDLVDEYPNMGFEKLDEFMKIYMKKFDNN